MAQYKWDVFISYSSKDMSLIQSIIDNLKRYQLTYWLDIDQIKPGDSISNTIEKGLEGSRSVLVCFSRNQLQSGWSRREYESILNEVLSGRSQQKILPLVLDDLNQNEIPFLFRNHKYERFLDPNGNRNLIQCLKKP